MKVDWKDPADRQRLRALIDVEPNAKQRDRYRVVLIAGEGMPGPGSGSGSGSGSGQPEVHREQIARTVGRSRQFVDEWVGRYRKGGIDALMPRRQPGAPCRLTLQEQQQLCAMLDAGPAPDEGLAAYNGPILRQKIAEHFGKLYTLDGVYKLLHRLRYNDLMPRTTHPDTDPAALEAFKKKSCPRSSSRSGPIIPISAS